MPCLRFRSWMPSLFCSLFFFGLSTFCLSAEGAAPDKPPKESPEKERISCGSVRFQVNPSTLLRSRAVADITATDEWRRFYATLNDRLDRGYEKAKQSPGFPKELDVWFQETIRGALDKETLSFRDLIDAFFKYTDTVILDLDLVYAEEEAVDPETPFRAEGTVTIVVNFVPGLFAGALDILKEGRDYTYLRDSGGITILQSLDKKVLVAGGTELRNSDKFAVVIGRSRTSVESRLVRLSRATPGEIIEKDMLGRLSGTLSTEVISEIRKKEKDGKLGFHLSGETRDLIRFCRLLENKIASFDCSFRDADGETRAIMSVTTALEEDARLIRQMAEGSLATFIFLLEGRETLPTEQELLLELLKSIRIEEYGNQVTTSLRCNQTVLTFIQFLLQQGSDRMRAERAPCLPDADDAFAL